MAQLQTSGAISLNDIHQNIGGTSGTAVSLNDTDVKQLIYKTSSSNNSMNDYYGAFWNKNTITMNCGECSYIKTFGQGTQYQGNYTKNYQGWCDVAPNQDNQVTSGTGPVAFGSLTDNSDYGRSIRLNGGTTVYIRGIFTESPTISTFGSIQKLVIVEQYSKSKPNHASPPATYRDAGHPNTGFYFGGDATEPVVPGATGGYQFALNNTTAGRAPHFTNTNYSGGKIEASVAASTSSYQGSIGYADRKGTYMIDTMIGFQNNALAPTNHQAYQHSVGYPGFSTGDWFNQTSGNNNTGYPRALPHTGQCTITFS